MKKKLRFILTLLLLSLAFQTSAQSHKYTLGLELGGNRSCSYGNDLLRNNAAAITRTSGGVSFQLNLNSVFAIKTGLAYEQKGFTTPFWFGSYENIGTLKFLHTYLTVPVLVRATFGNKFRYFVNTGPYIGFALTHKYSFEEPGKADLENDINKEYKPLDYGFSLGAGISYPLNPRIDLSLEARNNLGLKNIANGINPFKPSEGFVYKTNSQTLLFGLSYKIGEL
ncbi:PorT family protein [Adhaeribacter sp. BT258]|uniref:PorT family protein n=1 Tax=Adhaeribacter terrigena TaxID=2793070 RepID=A0ABS1C677_9BACT|nr:porin family protein [Adhaeribacter terrigena]MBK0404864.1 PorT family protein [Adhaeribacter terrigena]